MEPSSTDAPPLVERRFTTGDPLDAVTWTRRTARAGNFVQENVEAPEFWSDNAVGITAKLYFATVDGRRENSIRTMIERVAGRITDEGMRHEYFAGNRDETEGRPIWSPEAWVFYHELCYLLVNQMAAFNTPVWLNVGVPGRKQVCSACFLLSVEDTMHGDHSITDWWSTEARIFKGGAGSGVNVSNIRGSTEPLSTGGVASGPLPYMRVADAGAGTLKSGGAHRRAAKMVIENADHPDIRDFVGAKRREDQRMRDLAAAGHEVNPFTESGEKVIAETTSFQNANVSVGASNRFMELATGDDPDPRWQLWARVTGRCVEEIDPRVLLDDIADAAWRCADPGIVFLDTVNAWHTTPVLRGKPSPITTCNPCAETWLNDDSSCNLASLNLLKFVETDGTFGIESFRHAVDVMVLAMDITCSFSDLPTEEITSNTRELRQLGLGYSNLGASLMALAMPYDSDIARDWAASVTALMTGRAYRRSAELAERFGPYARFEENREAHLSVITKHFGGFPKEYMHSAVWVEAVTDWADALEIGNRWGYRNSQATVLAPTGTISYLMDCDTTGIEPAFSLVTHKGLAGGGSMLIVNRAVDRALRFMGCDLWTFNPEEPEVFLAELAPEERRVFACANDISPMGHLRMVAAVQPFLSGAPSKTINLANSATREDIREIFVEAWRSGCKAVSVYRNGSKATQVLTTSDPGSSSGRTASRVEEEAGSTPAPGVEPVRKRLPNERQSITHKFSVGGYEGYITAGMYEDGQLGEFFLTDVGKEGSFLQGMMNAWSIACSIDFQYGVPLDVLARKFVGMEFEPKGLTGNRDVPEAKSIPDYVFRWLASKFLDADACEELGVLTREVRDRMTARLDAATTAIAAAAISGVSIPTPVVTESNGHVPQAGTRPCPSCGALMIRSGSCYTCSSCGANTGCG